MGSRFSDDYDTPRSGAGNEERHYQQRSRGSRSNLYDDVGEQRRERQHAGRWMRDDEPPDVRFGRNVGDAGDYGSEGTLRDFRDRTSRGEHSGYGDYGQEDYYGTQRGAGGGEYGGRGDFGQSSSRDFGETDFNRTRFDRYSMRGQGQGQRYGYGYSRRDYRGNVGPAGYGYAESSYGPGATYGAQRSSHRGRGPKGYSRSDERLKEILCEQLTEHPEIDASDISITVSSGVVQLEGTVDDRWTKYQVEEMAGNIGGVKDVRNQLRVQSQSEWGSGASSGVGNTGGNDTGSSRGKSSSSGSSGKVT